MGHSVRTFIAGIHRAGNTVIRFRSSTRHTTSGRVADFSAVAEQTIVADNCGIPTHIAGAGVRGTGIAVVAVRIRQTADTNVLNQVTDLTSVAVGVQQTTTHDRIMLASGIGVTRIGGTNVSVIAVDIFVDAQLGVRIDSVCGAEVVVVAVGVATIGGGFEGFRRNPFGLQRIQIITPHQREAGENQNHDQHEAGSKLLHLDLLARHHVGKNCPLD